MHKSIYFLTILFVILQSCNNYSKTESGLKFKILKRGTSSVLPENGQYVQCQINIANDEDSVFYSTYNKSPERILLTNATHKGGDIMDALKVMAIGDSAQFLISADSFFLKTRQEIALPNHIKTGSFLKFTIKMENFLTRSQVDSLINLEKMQRWTKEITTINEYVKKNGLETRIDSASGLRFQFHKQMPDTSAKVSEGKIVTFHFIGKLMDGTEFFNTYTMGHPQSVKIFRDQFQPIGMYEMLIKMKEGEKATFILPFDLAFGAKGVEGMIPPFSSLVYEINILKVK